ncbi:MAG: PKD domain-containing protein [Flavobacteriales bacterium]|nr:PKD domain-containing protein [Flavobacteriales bacterium]
MRHATLLFAALLSLQGWAQNNCDGLNAAFTWASTTATGNPVQFSNATAGTGQQTTWLWDFGDGTTSNEAQPMHEFPGPGTYEVCLTAITVFILPSGEALTCVDDYCTPVTVGGGGDPCDGFEAGFTWMTTASGNGVVFSNGTTGTGFQTTWQWIFGDGTTSTEAQPDHAYAEPGTYTVCLVATTIFETTVGLLTCVDESCTPVTVGGANNCSWLSANFTWAAGNNGVEFHYQPSGPTGTQYTYLWSFGDGSTASTQNAFHSYAANGTYEACLTVTAYTTNSSSPCTATSCQAVTTSSTGNACAGLNAAFTWASATAIGNPVQFSNATTGTGQQTTWLWDFGDGTTSNEAQPMHEFPGPGTYEVCLTAITVFILPSGEALTCVDEHCAAVVVQGANNCSWLSANFTWAAGNNGVEFHYQPSGPTGTQYTYLWSFGDGSTASTQNAFHSYAANGTYEACLTVTAYTTNSSSPCTATSCQAVTTSSTGNACAGLNAAFTWASATAIGNPVQFSNATTGTGQQTTWLWDFGDGTTSNEAQPMHEFPGPGTYEVCLTAITVFISPNAPALTCVDDICTSVVVAGDPQACDPSFALEIESEATNSGFVLSAATNIPNSGITWTFANGLVLYGPTIQVGLLSVMNIELCITAWYQPANSTDTCWTEVCGLLSELGFAVSVDETTVGAFRAWPNPAVDAVYIDGLGTGHVRVSIHGADGRVERELTVVGSPARVDLSGLAAGLKWVTLNSTDRTERFKLVKE